MAKLHVLDGRSEGKCFDLFRGESYEIGTARKVEIRLRDSGISYRHALLEHFDDGKDEECFRLREQRAKSGTEINGVPLVAGHPFRLTHQDKIKLGPVTLYYTLVGKDEEEEQEGEGCGPEGCGPEGAQQPPPAT